MLPTHSGNRHNKGLSGIGTVNWIVVGSMLWVITSIILIILGFRHCSNNARFVNFTCDKDICTFKQVLYSGNEKTIVTMNKNDIREVDIVRIDKKGIITDVKEVDDRGRRKYAKLGQTLRLKAMIPATSGSRISAEKVFIFSSYDLGRRHSKTYLTRIQRWKDNQGSDKISVSSSKGVTGTGIIMIFLGIISLVTSLILGVFKDETKKKIKKAM